MGRDGDGECKDFTKGVCFRGARFIFLIPYCMDMICTNILILLISAASIGMLGINKIRTQSHSAKTFRAIGIYSFQVYIYIHIFILKLSRKRANPILTAAAITNRTTGEAVHLCTRLVRPLKSTIGQVSGLDLFSSNTFGASIITSSWDLAKAVCFIFWKHRSQIVKVCANCSRCSKIISSENVQKD